MSVHNVRLLRYALQKNAHPDNSCRDSAFSDFASSRFSEGQALKTNIMNQTPDYIDRLTKLVTDEFPVYNPG